MADEDIKEDAPAEVEEGKKDSKVCAYKLTVALGDNAIGAVIHVPEEVGDELVKAGVAELASAEDVGGGEEMPEEEMSEEPMITNSINRLTKKVEKALSETILKHAEKVKPMNDNVPHIPAAIVKKAHYKNAGAYAVGIMRAKFLNDKDAAYKVEAYQEEAAQVYSDLGYRDVKIEKSILGINESTNSSGGYLVNPQYSPDVYVIPHGQLDLLSMCETINAESNVYNQRFINETSLANGSIFGGLNQVATAEGASFTSSLPAWSNVTFTLQKLAIFNYYTTEVLQDASYPVERELNDYIAKAFLYGLNTQIVQGSTFEGLLNCPSLVTVTHSSNDTAFTATPSTNLTYADLASIWASVYPDCQASDKGIWLFHPSLINPLSQMTYTWNGTTPAWSINYSAEDGLSGNGPMTPYRIFGKKAYPSWSCSAPGVAGDIIFVDMNTVKAYKKPFRLEVSKEVQFLTDQIAVRAVNRMDVKSVFRNKVTGVSGSQQFGNIVTRSSTGT